MVQVPKCSRDETNIHAEMTLAEMFLSEMVGRLCSIPENFWPSSFIADKPLTVIEKGTHIEIYVYLQLSSFTVMGRFMFAHSGWERWTYI